MIAHAGISLVGRRYQRLVVLAFAGVNRYGRREWRCRCDCGSETVVVTGELTTGSTKSCGCCRRKWPTMREFLSARDGQPGCWEYPSRRSGIGYALYKKGGKESPAHREAYRCAKGPLPDWLYVCHTCDNPPCVRPDHLFAGTAKDNQADSRSKDRHARGERNGFSKLSAAQVEAIRSDPRTQVVIAAEYGIRQTTVSELKRMNRWKHL